MTGKVKKRFRVAFSFAGEKRDYVAKVAEILTGRFGPAAILYDRYLEAEFARPDLASYLPKLYHDESDLIVVVVCSDYERKEWCGLEWRAIFALVKQRKDKEIMLLRFGRASVEDLYSLAGYVDLDDKTPKQTADLIIDRLALNEGQSIDSYTSNRMQPVSDGKECRLIVDQSYGQDQWLGGEGTLGEPTLTAGYSGIQSSLGASTLCAVQRNGYGRVNALEATDVLVLPMPYNSVPDFDCGEIVRWVKEGGGLLVLGFYLMEQHHVSNLNDLLRLVGLEFRRDLLMPIGQESPEQCTAQSFKHTDSSLWIVSGLDANPPAHPILTGVDKIALTSSCSVECVERPELLVETAEQVSVFHASGYRDLKTGRICQITGWIPEGRRRAPFMASRRYGKGRVVAIGSWKVFLNEFTENEAFGNAKLLSNCIRWLCGARDQIARTMSSQPENFPNLDRRTIRKDHGAQPPQPGPVQNPKDMQKGRWGGEAEQRGRRLEVVLQDVYSDYFTMNMVVSSTDHTSLEAPVVFHLHDTYPRSIIRVRRMREDRWAMLENVTADGVYTIGVQVKDGNGKWVGLEYDLARLKGLPKRFMTM